MRKQGLILILIISPIIAFCQAADSLSVGDYMFGGLSLSKLAAGYIFAFIGIIFRWLVLTVKGVKNSANTPDNFSWGFWFRANVLIKLASAASVIIAIFLLYRYFDHFFSEYLVMFDVVDIVVRGMPQFVITAVFVVVRFDVNLFGVDRLRQAKHFDTQAKRQRQQGSDKNPVSA